MARTLVERITTNPFYVLGVGPTASRTDIEREGNKLLSMLSLNLKEAKVYRSPLGEHPRSEELVREAMAELREPKRRLVHELLAALPASAAIPAVASPNESDEKWTAAPMVFGYGADRER